MVPKLHYYLVNGTFPNSNSSCDLLSNARKPFWTLPEKITFRLSNSSPEYFSNFSCRFLNLNYFSNLNPDCSNVFDLRNLQEQVKNAFCYQKLFWPFTVWINCSSYLKNLANSRPAASNFKSFSRSLEQFFLTVSRSEQFW